MSGIRHEVLATANESVRLAVISRYSPLIPIFGLEITNAGMDDGVAAAFGKRLRVRGCGVYLKDGKVLLVGHRGLVRNHIYWCPPGGGIEFGETGRQAVEREMFEETGIRVKAGQFMFVREFLAPPLHAVEFYFLVQTQDSDAAVSRGADPELGVENQLISEVRYMTLDEILTLPKPCTDPVFHHIDSLEYLGDERNWPSIQRKLI